MIKYLLLTVHVLLFVFFSFKGTCQEQKEIDSLKSLLIIGENKNESIYEISNKIGEYYSFLNIDSSIYYYQKGYLKAKETNDFYWLSVFSHGLGLAYQDLDLVKSYSFLLESINYAEKSGNSDLLLSIYEASGKFYLNKNNPQKAEEYYNYVLDYALEAKDTLLISKTYNSLGIANMMQVNYEIGLEYWLKALELKTAIGDHDKASATKTNIGLYYKDIGKYQESESYLKDALEHYLSTSHYRGTANNYSLLGELYFKKGDLNKAINNFKSSLEYATKANAFFIKKEPLIGLAQVYESKKEYNKAVPILYEYIELLEREFDENNAKVIEELTTRFETAKKEKEILKTKLSEFINSC